MNTVLVALAAASLALSLSFLWPSPRVGVLLDMAESAPGRGRVRHRLELLKAIPRSRVKVGLLAGVVCWLGLGNSVVGIVAGIAAVPLSMALLARAEAAPERQRQQQLITQLPECLELLAAALDAGVPLRGAVQHVATLAPEPSAGLLTGVLGHLQIGRSDAQAWATLHDHPVWGPMARDLARCADSGAGVAEVLGVHATEARARRRAQRELQARTVSVRSVLPLVSCFLPAFVLVGVVPIIAGTFSSFLHGS